MTLATPVPLTNPRTFFFCGLGSLFFHSLLVIILAVLTQQATPPETPPSVQVRLLPPVQVQEAQPSSPEPIKPIVPTRTPRTAPPPQSSLSTPLPPKVPPPAIRPPQQPINSNMASLKLPTLSKSMLTDNRASRALQAREFMKMTPHEQPPKAVPFPSTVPIGKPSVMNSHIPPKKISPTTTTTPSLPSIPPSSRRQPLMASAPSASGTYTSKPSILASSRPIYPRIARESGWEGTVVLRTLIDPTGNPIQVKIRKSSGHPILDREAEKAIKKWKFQPAKDGNIPIAKWVDIPIKFDLNR